MQYIFKGIKGMQWGKEVYVSQITFNEIQAICRVDNDVQREVNKSRIDEIADYILKPFKNTSINAGFNSLVGSLRLEDLESTKLIYDEKNNDIRVSTSTKLYICDGQHRYNGMLRALDRVKEELQKSKTNNDIENEKYWKSVQEKISEMSIPIVIFIGLTVNEEKQLFYDLNNLSIPVSKSIGLERDNNNMYNRIAKQLAEEISLVKVWGIDSQKKELGVNSRKIATLATWNDCVKILINGEADANNPWNDSWDFDQKKKLCLEFWNEIFNIMPKEFTNKRHYIVTKTGYYMKGIAEFGHNIINSNVKGYKGRVAKLKRFNWQCNNKIYSKYGWNQSKDKKGYICSGTKSGIKDVSKILQEYISK
ncbi:MAG: DGQHR domain-containing protein [Clostridium butyricum]|nr:DGQHR domain-containing protein [Clostridium butyricum]